MCSDIDGRPGPIRAAVDWIRGRHPTTEGLDPEDPDGPAAFKAWIRERDHTRDERAGRPRCEQCGAVRTEDDGIVHRRWCATCDLRWIEDIIVFPLVCRLGRKRARAALIALVKGEIGPTAWK
jgi:hypothetical protein